MKFHLILSGVASGWHGWTMSRGPGARGGPDRQREKEDKEKKREGWGPESRLSTGPEHLADNAADGAYPRVQPGTAGQTSRQHITSSLSAPSIVHQMVSMA